MSDDSLDEDFKDACDAVIRNAKQRIVAKYRSEKRDADMVDDIFKETPNE
jgi:hypothetical protein